MYFNEPLHLCFYYIKLPLVLILFVVVNWTYKLVKNINAIQKGEIQKHDIFHKNLILFVKF